MVFSTTQLLAYSPLHACTVRTQVALVPGGGEKSSPLGLTGDGGLELIVSRPYPFLREGGRGGGGEEGGVRKGGEREEGGRGREGGREGEGEEKREGESEG